MQARALSHSEATGTTQQVKPQARSCASVVFGYLVFLQMPIKVESSLGLQRLGSLGIHQRDRGCKTTESRIAIPDLAQGMVTRLSAFLTKTAQASDVVRLRMHAVDGLLEPKPVSACPDSRQSGAGARVVRDYDGELPLVRTVPARLTASTKDSYSTGLLT